MNKSILYLSLAVMGLYWAGCASVPKTSPELDAQAKTFSPKPGMANVYVNRGGGMGTAITFQVVLDGRIVGSLAPYSYHLLEVEAGSHSIGVISHENTKQVQIETEAGRNYFLDVDVTMGWGSGRAALKVVDEETGREMVLKSKRAESMKFGP